MKITSLIYKTLVGTLNILPGALRNFMFIVIKKSGIPNDKFYKDLRYNGMVNVDLEGKSFLMLATGGTIENELFWKDIHTSLEPETIWIWVNLLEKGVSSIIDVGANTGLYSLMSKSINPQTEIIAFEPSRVTNQKLVKNIERNGFDIRTEQLALSDKAGELLFYDTKDGNQTAASLSPRVLKEKEENQSILNEYRVQVTTLDNYIQENNVSDIDLVKIDVELHEPEVFAGMKNLIEKEQPFLIFEVLLPDIADRLNDFFKNQDYKLYDFVKHGNDFFLREVEKLEGRPNSNWNYFGCPTIKEATIEELIKR